LMVEVKNTGSNWEIRPLFFSPRGDARPFDRLVLLKPNQLVAEAQPKPQQLLDLIIDRLLFKVILPDDQIHPKFCEYVPIAKGSVMAFSPSVGTGQCGLILLPFDRYQRFAKAEFTFKCLKAGTELTAESCGTGGSWPFMLNGTSVQCLAVR